MRRVRISVGVRAPELPRAAWRRTRPRAYPEWKALRRWAKLPAWEPLVPGYELRLARERAGMTQSELAARLLISQQAVARAEGPRSNPTMRFFESWASAVGCRAEIRLRTDPAASSGARAR